MSSSSVHTAYTRINAHTNWITCLVKLGLNSQWRLAPNSYKYTEPGQGAPVISSIWKGSPVSALNNFVAPLLSGNPRYLLRS